MTKKNSEKQTNKQTKHPKIWVSGARAVILGDPIIIVGTLPPLASTHFSMPKPREAQCYRFHFTWNITEDQTEAEFEDKQPILHNIINDYAKNYCYQLEKKTKLHYQGWMKVNERKRCKQLAKELQDLGLKGIHLSTEAKEGSFTYCTKEETRVKGPWMDKEKNKETEKQRRNEKYKRKPKPWYDNLYPWQQDLRNILEQPPDDRSILWIWDEPGNSGKTGFCNYYRTTGEDVCVFQYGKANDIQHMVVEKGAHRTYIWDLTRGKPADLGTQDLYNNLETIKNGYICCGKYKGGEIDMESPHVVVFANYKPEFHHMSKDRWKLYYINQNKELKACINEHVN